MVRRFLNLLRRSPRHDPHGELVNVLTDRFMQKLAAASQSAEKPNELTPKEGKVIFEFVRDLLLDWALERYRGFDLDVLKIDHAEKFWALVEFGVRVDKLTQPVSRDALQTFLNEYASAIGEAAALAHNRERAQ